MLLALDMRSDTEGSAEAGTVRGEELSEEEVRDFCKGHIAHFKIPKTIWFVDEFPMTVTGKLQKFRMREMALEKLQGK